MEESGKAPMEESLAGQDPHGPLPGGLKAWSRARARETVARLYANDNDTPNPAEARMPPGWSEERYRDELAKIARTRNGDVGGEDTGAAGRAPKRLKCVHGQDRLNTTHAHRSLRHAEPRALRVWCDL